MYKNKFKKIFLGLLGSAVFVFVGVLLWGIFGQETASVAKDQVTETRCDAEDVEELVKCFYASQAEGDIDAMLEFMGDDTSNRLFQQVTVEALLECGFLGYGPLTVSVYPLKETDWWVAVVVYDMLLEGIDSPLPGCDAVLVQMSEDGSGLIFTYDVEPSMKDEVSLIIEEDFGDVYDEINQKFSEILWEYPEFFEWEQEFSQVRALRRADLLSQQEGSEESNVSGEPAVPAEPVVPAEPEEWKEPEAPTEELYMVRKGDCLWHIAEDTLGDGARWVELYEANKDIIGGNPNLILIRMELHIP